MVDDHVRRPLTIIYFFFTLNHLPFSFHFEGGQSVGGSFGGSVGGVGRRGRSGGGGRSGGRLVVHQGKYSQLPNNWTPE